MKKLFRIVYYMLVHVCKLQNPKIAMFTLLTTILNVEVPSIIWDTTSQIMLQKSSTVIWKLQSSIPAMNVFASLCHVMSLSYHCRAVWPRSPAAHHHTYASKYAQCRGQHVCQGQHVSNSVWVCTECARERVAVCQFSARCCCCSVRRGACFCTREDVISTGCNVTICLDGLVYGLGTRAGAFCLDGLVCNSGTQSHASACCLFYISLLACSYWVHDCWGFYTLCLSIYYEWPCG